jgi:hypothetical protein
MSFSNDLIKIASVLFVASLMLSVSVTAGSASEAVSHGSAAAPDMTVILGATGQKVSGASVFIDDKLVGKTDSKGNFTFAEKPHAGSAIKVVKKGLKDTVVAYEEGKPLIVKTYTEKPGKKTTIAITDRNTKHGIEGATIYNGDYVIGTANDKGEVTIDDFPFGLYLIKIKKDGYRSTTTLLIVTSDKTHKYMLTPDSTAKGPEEHSSH